MSVSRVIIVTILLALLHCGNSFVYAQDCGIEGPAMYTDNIYLCYSDAVDLNSYLEEYLPDSVPSWTNPLGQIISNTFSAQGQPNGVYTCNFVEPNGCPATLGLTITIYSAHPPVYLYVCEGAMAALFAAFPYQLPPGGIFAGPNGVPNLGFFDSNSQPFGTYSYTYISSGPGCTLMNLIHVVNANEANAGTNATAANCNGESFSPFELLGGNPAPGGTWMHLNSSTGTVVGNYGWDVVLDPANMSTNNSLTYTVGSQPCNLQTSQLNVTIVEPYESPEFHLDLCIDDEPFFLLNYIFSEINSGGGGGGGLSNYPSTILLIYLDISVDPPVYLGVFPSAQSLNYLLDPAAIVQQSLFIISIGAPPCAPHHIYFFVTVHDEQVLTENIISCLPYEWYGELYFEAGEYTNYNDTVSFCGLTETLILTELSGGSFNAAEPLRVCNGSIDGISPDELLTGVVGNNSAWMVLLTSGDEIATMAGDIESINWALLNAGTYLLQHVSYNNDAEIFGLNTVSEFQGCYNLSSTIPVEVEWFNSGVAGNSGSSVICLDQPILPLQVSVTGWSGPFAKWVITDELYYIISVAEASADLNISGLFPGNYYVFHAVFPSDIYLDGLTVFDLQSTCIEISNILNYSASSCFTGITVAESAENTELTDVIPEFWGISFNSDDLDQISAEIYDAQGRLISTFYFPQGSKTDFNTALINHNALGSGIYFYRINLPYSVKSGKLAVVR